MPVKFPDMGPVNGIFRFFFGAGCNFIMLMHVLNTLSDNASTSGYWYNNFAQALVACFGANILQKVLNGGNMVTAIFSDPPSDDMSLFGFFLVWYVINYDIPACPHKFGIWEKISDLGGEALENLLAYGSVMWVTNIVIKAVGEPRVAFSTGWFQAIALGVVYGTAGSFFPLNKGFKLSKSVEASHAFSIAVFLASNGFAIIDVFLNAGFKFIAEFTFNAVVIPSVTFGADVNKYVCEPFGGLAAFVIIVTSLNHFFGEYLPIKSKRGFDAFGCTEKTLAKFQLS